MNGADSATSLDLFVGGKHLTAKKKRPKQAELFNRRRRSRDAGRQQVAKGAKAIKAGTSAGPPLGVDAAAFFEQAGPHGGAEFGPAVALEHFNTAASELEPEPEPEPEGAWAAEAAAGSSDDEWFGGSPPQTVADAQRIEQEAKLEAFHAAVDTTFRQLQLEGISWLPTESLSLGKEISRGAFGVVKDAVAEIDGEEVEVAVKTLGARSRGHRTVLRDFENEVRMGWLASWKTRTDKQTSRVLRMFGIAYNLTKNRKRAQLRIVMERVNCDGDMHDEIHAEEHWV